MVKSAPCGCYPWARCPFHEKMWQTYEYKRQLREREKFNASKTELVEEEVVASVEADVATWLAKKA